MEFRTVYTVELITFCAAGLVLEDVEPGYTDVEP
jgi:hypothetical protein